MKLSLIGLSFISLAAFVGCTGQLPAEEVNTSAEQELASQNELTSNALDWNGLDWNGLDWNGLDWNGLDWNGLDWNGLDPGSTNAAIQASIQSPNPNGELARSFIRYVISCAFDSSRAFTFSWTDANGVSHPETYPGHLGLAPHWETKHLGLNGERIVSACMAAHVNYYGTPVMISIRSGEKPIRLNPFDPELVQYSKIEGAFWGNLWAPQPYINACYNSANVNNSRAKMRDCAAGHLLPDGTTEECGVINIVGTCASACKKYRASRGYYEDCREQPGVNNKRTDLVITTALP